MNYYEVLVGDMQYHGESALTYAADQKLERGAVVRVPLRARGVLGIVLRAVPKPAFATKPISAVLSPVPLPPESLSLLNWLRSYYPAPLGAVVRQFVPASGAKPKPYPAASAPADSVSLPPLTTEQRAALATIEGAGSFLLHGITGSGKSRVYLELARRNLAAGRSSIILTPEIGLTAQLTGAIRQALGAQVFVLHSALTVAERRDIWYTLLERTEPAVIIGPRSALFGPLHNIGLIAMDEAHDNAYKNESAPHYHAARVGAKLAQLHGAMFVSGSATPSIEDYYLAVARKRPVVAMNTLARTASKRTVMFVDLRDRGQLSRSRILSDPLLAALTAALSRGEQSLLFLNRRGTANVVLCNACGWQLLCPHCDLPLTYHGDEHRLRCHVCGFHTHLLNSCPQCGNTEILLKSIGTKAVLQEVERLFSTARVQRFDTDLKKDERLEQHISALQNGSADIIVGTQMIAKGLDLPRLSLVGIIAADSSLLLPDYTATEHTYQLISQVIGRTGRGHGEGTVILQTYDPENLTLRTAAAQDWDAFYDRELRERQQFHFPPFRHLLRLSCARASSVRAQKAAEELAETLRHNGRGLEVEGPSPAFHPRENSKYKWQLILKSATRGQLIAVIDRLPSGWSYDIDPVNLL